MSTDLELSLAISGMEWKGAMAMRGSGLIRRTRRKITRASSINGLLRICEQLITKQYHHYNYIII
jgi:hypothetical protein